MIDQIQARLTIAQLTARVQTEAPELDFSRAGTVIVAAREALADGVIGYGLLVRGEARVISHNPER